MSEMFRKSVGDFELDVSPPYPRWVTIKHRRYATSDDVQELDGMNSDALRDLQYLIGEALRFVSLQEERRNA